MIVGYVGLLYVLFDVVCCAVLVVVVLLLQLVACDFEGLFDCTFNLLGWRLFGCFDLFANCYDLSLGVLCCLYICR